MDDPALRARVHAAIEARTQMSFTEEEVRGVELFCKAVNILWPPWHMLYSGSETELHAQEEGPRRPLEAQRSEQKATCENQCESVEKGVAKKRRCDQLTSERDSENRTNCRAGDSSCGSPRPSSPSRRWRNRSKLARATERRSACATEIADTAAADEDPDDEDHQELVLTPAEYDRLAALPSWTAKLSAIGQVLAAAGIEAALVVAAEAIGCDLETREPRLNQNSQWVCQARLQDKYNSDVARAQGSQTSGPAALREAYCSLLAVAIDRIMDTMAKDEEGSGMSHETLQRYLQDRKHVIQLAAVHTSRRKRLSVLGLRFHENGSCYPISSSEQSVHLRWYHMRRYLLPSR
jgi:hypothetical protein